MPDSAAPSGAKSRSARGALAPLTLVFGGARSGKSSYAEALLAGAAAPVYLASAEAHDDEMRERIRVHRARRDGRWTTVEAPRDLAGALVEYAVPGRAVLVDCLTLWLSNLMGAGAPVGPAIDGLLAALPRLAAPVVLVSNEVGMGIVPDNEMAREFRDHAGRLNQRVAQACQRAVFIAAGLPLILKDEWNA